MYSHWRSSLFLISVSILPFSSWLFSFLIISYHFPLLSNMLLLSPCAKCTSKLYRFVYLLSIIFISQIALLFLSLQICGGIHHFHQGKVCPTGPPCCSAIKLGGIPFHLHSKLDFSQAGTKITHDVPYFGFALHYYEARQRSTKYVLHCSLYTVIEKNKTETRNIILCLSEKPASQHVHK